MNHKQQSTWLFLKPEHAAGSHIAFHRQACYLQHGGEGADHDAIRLWLSIRLHCCSTSRFSRHLGLLVELVTLTPHHISQLLIYEAKAHVLIHYTARPSVLSQNPISRLLGNTIL
jgi:hypothetical protein